METIDKKILSEIRMSLGKELAEALKTAYRWLKIDGEPCVAYAWQTNYGGANMDIYEISYNGHAVRADFYRYRAFVQGSWSNNMTEAMNRGIQQILEDAPWHKIEKIDKESWIRLYTAKTTASSDSDSSSSSREDTFYDTHEAFGAFGPCD